MYNLILKKITQINKKIQNEVNKKIKFFIIALDLIFKDLFKIKLFMKMIKKLLFNVFQYIVIMIILKIY